MIELEFTHTDEAGNAETFTSDARDLYVWESMDKQGRAFLSVLRDGTPRMVDLYRLSWVAARRLGLIDKTTAEATYSKQYVVKVDLDDSSEPDPTLPAASGDG